MASKSRSAGKRSSARRGAPSAKKAATAKKGGRAGAKPGRSKGSGKKPAPKPRLGRAAAGSRKTARKATRSKGKRAANSATSARKGRAVTRPRVAAKRSSGRSSAATATLGKNPLTRRGTRSSRTQLLIEHQAAPIETAAESGAPGAGPDARDSNLGELVRNTEVRNQSLKSRAERSMGKVVDNHLAVTANARIRGHASGAGRRAQGRRDAAQRGEKRPDKPGYDF